MQKSLEDKIKEKGPGFIQEALNDPDDENTIKKLYKEFKKKSRKGKMSPALFYEMYQKLCPNDKNARGDLYTQYSLISKSRRLRLHWEA